MYTPEFSGSQRQRSKAVPFFSACRFRGLIIQSDHRLLKRRIIFSYEPRSVWLRSSDTKLTDFLVVFAASSVPGDRHVTRAVMCSFRSGRWTMFSARAAPLEKQQSTRAICEDTVDSKCFSLATIILLHDSQLRQTWSRQPLSKQTPEHSRLLFVAVPMLVPSRWHGM